MATVDVRSTSDPVVALDAGAAFPAAPSEHNSIILSVLAERGARYEEGRYWWARRDGEVVGYAMQSPPRSRAVAAPAGRDLVAALAALAVGCGRQPVSMAAARATAAGVARVAFVYTLPEHRRHGYAAAGVAALSTRLLGQGVNCILHTQLHNATSNGVHRRIGYEAMGEVLIYRCG
jgi:L-amino acid N-acyltransferase YncA